MALLGVIAAWLAPPAFAAWQLKSTTTASIAYNEGIAFDQALGNFYLDGVISTSNSALYRANTSLAPTGANLAVLATKEGYNHVGDLSFDPVRRRLILPLECYDPFSNPSNTCGKGAFGVADPATLKFLYYVNLWKPQIQKAMWDEISPDGRWIWTSSGTHLLAYRAANVNVQTAANQRSGAWGGLGGTDLGAVLPGSGVTGATFYAEPVTGVPRLFLAVDRGTYFQVISYRTGTAPGGAPVLLSARPRTEITLNKSFSNAESEGLTVTGRVHGSYPLGAVLHWQMLPSLKLYSRILNFAPK
jgi:hypothetical protein